MGAVVTGARPPVAFAGSATEGVGGQGQFLRSMIRALEAWGPGRVYARQGRSPRIEVVPLPFRGGWRRAAFDGLLQIPVLRGRNDWLTLLDDEDFDGRLAAALTPAGDLALLDGIMAQCLRAFQALDRRGVVRVMTSISTHPDHLSGVMAQEAGHLGVPFSSFVHPRMVRRARQEIERADHIRVNSAVAKATFVDAGIPAEKVSFVHVGIDLDHFRPVPPVDEVFRVIVVGAIAPHKGTRYVIDAFERAAIPGAELLLVGGTGDRWSRRLLDQARARGVRLVQAPMDSATEPVAKHYGRASVLLHASLVDGFGLVVPEALACGCPAIVTQTTGASDLIQNGVNGFVVAARDSQAMADRLRLLAADRALLERMREAAPATVAHLSYDGFARAVGALYDRMLGRA